MSRGMEKSLFNIMFLGPGLVLFLVIFMYPNVISFYYALTNYDGLSSAKYIGWVNFKYILTDDVFMPALLRTIKYAIIVTIFQNIAGLLLALALDSKFMRTKNILRSIFYAPAVVSLVIIGYVWLRIYDSNGALNTFFGYLHLESLQRLWLGDPDVTFYAVMVVNVWQFMGYSMIIYLSNLQIIPDHLKETAQIDGASVWQRFRYITFPMLAPSVTINVVLTMIGTLNIFDYIYALTTGGPMNSTITVNFFIYEQGLRAGRAGYASAGAIISFIFVAIFTFITLYYLRKRELKLE